PQLDPVRQIVLYELTCRGGDKHLSTVGDSADASGAMDTDADIALVADFGLPAVEAHSNCDSGFARPYVCGNSALCGHRCRYCVSRCPKCREERVALCIDNATAVRRERRPQDRCVIRQHALVAIRPVILEQLCGSLDVCKQEGNGAAWQLR